MTNVSILEIARQDFLKKNEKLISEINKISKHNLDDSEIKNSLLVSYQESIDSYHTFTYLMKMVKYKSSISQVL